MKKDRDGSVTLCPRCRKPSDADWPLKVRDAIKDGGCQDCWEAECSKSWWQEVERHYRMKEDSDE